MENLPPLTLGDISYIPNGKPVIVIYHNGDAVEFGRVQAAQTHLETEKSLGNTAAHFARIFEFKDGHWNSVYPAAQ